ncbi:MAG: molybdopterin molybdotransferase MoeA [Phycisphaerales bacterium]
MNHPLPDYTSALDRALACVQPLPAMSIERDRAIGCVLRAAIVADRDQPPFNRAMMDGYAVRAADVHAGAAFAVTADIPAGARGQDVEVPAGACVKIATGAPLPEHCDAVIQHEVTDRSNPMRCSLGRIDPWHAVHRQGADARAGTEAVVPGTLLRAQHLAIAAGLGYTRLTVSQQPSVTIITSGDEVVSSSAVAIERQQIRNSNAPMLLALLPAFGAGPTHHVHVRDDYHATLAALEAALHTSDIIITVGGISAGERDFFPKAADALGIETIVSGAAIQPGKPIRIAQPRSDVRCRVLAGLPGNPVSALVTAHLFAWPLIRRMLDCSEPLPWQHRGLSTSVRPNSRRQAFRPAQLQSSGEVTVPSWSGSGDIIHTANTHGFVQLPVQEDDVRAGTLVPFLPWAR